MAFDLHAGGLSPHGRGNQLGGDGGECQGGPIPAWAGEPCQIADFITQGRAYPRMGGGTQVQTPEAVSYQGLSPHGRGNRGGRGRLGAPGGPIPAWAGEPGRGMWGRMAGRAYPRMGGGTRKGTHGYTADQGLSPHGRGNRCRPQVLFQSQGPIPAWAGEPRLGYLYEEAGGAYPRMGGGTSCQ